MDDIDRQLIDLLQADSRASTTALAKALDIARTTVTDRIRKLEEKGIIGGYTIRLNEAHAARRITAHVMLTVSPKAQDAVTSALKRLPFVSALYSISGQCDYIAIIRAPTTGDIDDALDRMGRIPGIDRTQSSIVLSTKFER